MFVTADQLVAHAIGDYIIQSDWMASEKTKRSLAALAHVVTYSLPFLFLTLSWKALLFIAATHFVIDRWRLARYVCWVKNWLAPEWITPNGAPGTPAAILRYPKGVTPDPTDPLKGAVLGSVRNFSWKDCSGTGYTPDKPAWLAVWLMIITDNTMHVLCNALALRYLT